MPKTAETHFLIIDDDAVDVLAMKRVLIEIDQEIEFSVASNGEEALFILRKLKDQPESPKQVIALLDLNMPRMGGVEFLDAIRSDETLCGCIVFVVSTSNDPVDIGQTYRRHIAGYIEKSSLNADRLRRLFENYLGVVTLPAAG